MYRAGPRSRGLSSLDRLSYGAVLLFFLLQPFRDALHRIVLVGSAWSLGWALAFSMFALLHAYSSGQWRTIRSLETPMVIVWTGYLLLAWIFSPAGEMVSAQFSSSTYELRYFLEPMPLFLLLVARGLRRSELNAILTIVVLMTPISIALEYWAVTIYSVSDVAAFAASGEGLSYNSYVPYTTFPLLAGIYLIPATKSTLLRVVIGFACAFIAGFILINPSRQSVLFVVFALLLVFAIARNFKAFMLVLVVASAAVTTVATLHLEERVTSRMLSPEFLETTRDLRMTEGLASIDGVTEWLGGKGLFLTLADGINPHNNFIFTIMRIGLVGAVLMFGPFFYSAAKLAVAISAHSSEKTFDRNLAAFLLICVVFVLYHSFFGYPHLDGLNGPIVWFGLSISVLFRRELVATQWADQRRAAVVRRQLRG